MIVKREIQTAWELSVPQREQSPWHTTFSTLKLLHQRLENKNQLQCFWAPALDVIALAAAPPLPVFAWQVCCFFTFTCIHCLSPDPSRRTVVQPHLTRPVIKLCTGNSLERMAVVDMPASRRWNYCLHLPYPLEISLTEIKGRGRGRISVRPLSHCQDSQTTVICCVGVSSITLEGLKEGWGTSLTCD